MVNMWKINWYVFRPLKKLTASNNLTRRASPNQEYLRTTVNITIFTLYKSRYLCILVLY